MGQPYMNRETGRPPILLIEPTALVIYWTHDHAYQLWNYYNQPQDQ